MLKNVSRRSWNEGKRASKSSASERAKKTRIFAIGGKPSEGVWSQAAEAPAAGVAPVIIGHSTFLSRAYRLASCTPARRRSRGFLLRIWNPNPALELLELNHGVNGLIRVWDDKVLIFDDFGHDLCLWMIYALLSAVKL
ncbi:hypothetical protein E3N88_25981 [Mikania micrantha]|uniref:Uncharacterized protein n=1 Tax=Mikania micrantha TaxID=192012 RepID=A0A5N6N789_9ASTR|nr:hypothetical protein E3N88_25981 [Mikania micrantha]